MPLVHSLFLRPGQRGSVHSGTPRPQGPLCCGQLPVLSEGALPPLPRLPSLLVSHKDLSPPDPAPLPCPLCGGNLEQQGRENWPSGQMSRV